MSRIKVIAQFPTDQKREDGTIIHDSIIFGTEPGEVFACKGGRNGIRLPPNYLGGQGSLRLTIQLSDEQYDAINCGGLC